jgi:hypothetical protein
LAQGISSLFTLHYSFYSAIARPFAVLAIISVMLKNP